MMSILDRKDVDDRTKVTLHNQVLHQYNILSDKKVKEPVCVVDVKESMPAVAAAAVTASAGAAEGASGALSSGIEADVVDTVPKTMQAIARRVMEHLKRDIAWTALGELILEGVPIAGSNVLDLLNNPLRKRKTDTTGWQPFAQQLRAINLPMGLVCNVARRAYICQAATLSHRSASAGTTATPRVRLRRSLSWTSLAHRRSHIEHSMLTPPPERRKALMSLASWEGF